MLALFSRLLFRFFLFFLFLKFIFNILRERAFSAAGAPGCTHYWSGSVKEVLNDMGDPAFSLFFRTIIITIKRERKRERGEARSGPLCKVNNTIHEIFPSTHNNSGSSSSSIKIHWPVHGRSYSDLLFSSFFFSQFTDAFK